MEGEHEEGIIVDEATVENHTRRDNYLQPSIDGADQKPGRDRGEPSLGVGKIIGEDLDDIAEGSVVAVHLAALLFVENRSCC